MYNTFSIFFRISEPGFFVLCVLLLILLHILPIHIYSHWIMARQCVWCELPVSFQLHSFSHTFFAYSIMK